MQKTQVCKFLNVYRDKYYSLVSYARRPRLTDSEECAGVFRRIADAYPVEVEELRSENFSFYHGFNSGCLAIIRLVEVLLECDSEDEVRYYEAEVFPELDTMRPPKEAG